MKILNRTGRGQFSILSATPVWFTLRSLRAFNGCTCEGRFNKWSCLVCTYSCTVTVALCTVVHQHVNILCLLLVYNACLLVVTCKFHSKLSAHVAPETSLWSKRQRYLALMTFPSYHLGMKFCLNLRQTIILLTLNTQLIALKRSYQTYMEICFKLVAVMAALCHNNITFHNRKAEKGYEILT